MEALWSLEDKWKLSTQKAVALFACTSFLLVSFCIFTALRRRGSKRRVAVYQEPPCNVVATGTTATPRWGTVKKALMSSVRWSERERPSPLLGRGRDFGWQSHNSTSPFWQRPILMGEKCELPRFSGLILYDERGRPLDHATCLEEKVAQVRTTLRDLL